MLVSAGQILNFLPWILYPDVEPFYALLCLLLCQSPINDSMLALSYVEAYDISYPEALKRIGDEVNELKQHIQNEGSVILYRSPRQADSRNNLLSFLRKRR